ncbi:MAG: GFA family protein [Dongiaceae bacterium]
MVEKTIPVTGGCLCGAVRFESTEPPANVGVCHCRMCQRSAGGPHMVWAFLPRRAFRFTRGEPVYYRSSAFAERGFCGACGSPLAFRDRTDKMSVPVGTFDHPEEWPPDLGHSGIESRILWDAITDHLPQFRTDEDPVVRQIVDAARNDR